MSTFRHVSAKRAWARLQERADYGERFGFIACLKLLYKTGALTREQLVKKVNEYHITREDLQKFDEHTRAHSSTLEHAEHYPMSSPAMPVIVCPDRFLQKFGPEALWADAPVVRRLPSRRHLHKRAEICQACIRGVHETCRSESCTCVHREVSL